MKVLYRDDQECLAENDQVPIMVEAGWSTEKPEVAPEEKPKAPEAPKK